MHWVAGLGVSPGHWAHREPTPHGAPALLEGRLLSTIQRLLDKITGPVVRRWNRPKLDVETVDRGALHMVNPDKVSVNVEVVIVNDGRGQAESYRAKARVTQQLSVSLGLVDPRNPRRRNAAAGWKR